jgi:uncharacterized membrane protein (UPF0127 family)
MRVRNLTKAVELADRAIAANTSELRKTGLLKHESLPEGEGLWIAPCEGVHTFFMKFPIDVVYLNKKRQIVKIRPNMPASRLSLCLSAHSVLELPAGMVAKTGTQVGDVLEFDKN